MKRNKAQSTSLERLLHFDHYYLTKKENDENERKKSNSRNS